MKPWSSDIPSPWNSLSDVTASPPMTTTAMTTDDDDQMVTSHSQQHTTHQYTNTMDRNINEDTPTMCCLLNSEPHIWSRLKIIYSFEYKPSWPSGTSSMLLWICMCVYVCLCVHVSVCLCVWTPTHGPPRPRPVMRSKLELDWHVTKMTCYVLLQCQSARSRCLLANCLPPFTRVNMKVARPTRMLRCNLVALIASVLVAESHHCIAIAKQLGLPTNQLLLCDSCACEKGKSDLNTSYRRKRINCKNI